MSPTSVKVRSRATKKPPTKTVQELESLYPDLSLTQIIDRLFEAQTVMLKALRNIHDTQGRVCEEFELCRHIACASSYASWQTADQALARVQQIAAESVSPTEKQAVPA